MGGILIESCQDEPKVNVGESCILSYMLGECSKVKKSRRRHGVAKNDMHEKRHKHRKFEKEKGGVSPTKQEDQKTQ